MKSDNPSPQYTESYVWPSEGRDPNQWRAKEEDR